VNYQVNCIGINFGWSICDEVLICRMRGLKAADPGEISGDANLSNMIGFVSHPKNSDCGDGLVITDQVI
jgi:hypothetical protein